ncbi:MAG: DUF1292 domain-containing protein, partial [Coprobacillus sp.]
KIQVVDENGKELEFDVLFTFNSEENGKKYVLYYDATEEAPQVFSSIYDDEGNLFPIETPEEWEMIEEVFSSFVAEDEDDDEECGHECCHGNDDHECCHDKEDHECCHEDDDHECCCKNEG